MFLVPSLAVGAGNAPHAVGPALRAHAWVNISGSNLTNVSTPTPRQAYGMAYDPLLLAIVLFGGNDAYGGALGDTWEFAHGHWHQVATTRGNVSLGPSARWSMGMTFDPNLGGVLLFGGQSTFLGGCGVKCALSDTWVFNSTGWHQLKLTSAPPAQPAPSLAYDTSDGYDLLLSHPVAAPTVLEEWRFVAGGWTNATKTIRGGVPNLGFFYTDNPAGNNLLLFGGSSGCSGAGLTWVYHNGTFRNITAHQTASPAAKMGSHASGYDPRLGGVVMTGGYDAYCTVSNQTWLFKLGHWQNISNQTGTVIPGRWDARLVWDGAVGPAGGDITFSGNEAMIGGSNSFGSDTWRLSP